MGGLIHEVSACLSVSFDQKPVSLYINMKGNSQTSKLIK